MFELDGPVLGFVVGAAVIGWTVGFVEGTLVGIADAEGASLSVLDGRPDFDGYPVGKMLGSDAMVGRLEGTPEGNEVTVIDGRPDCEGEELGVEEGWPACK